MSGNRLSQVSEWNKIEHSFGLKKRAMQFAYKYTQVYNAFM